MQRRIDLMAKAKKKAVRKVVKKKACPKKKGAPCKSGGTSSGGPRNI
jgi:hypothetical protein